MEVSYGRSTEALIVTANGRVDESSWSEFSAYLVDGVRNAANQSLWTMIIDLSKIDYMSSRGLRALTIARQEGIASGVSVRLAVPNEVMREILSISRYNRLFPVDESLPPDIASLT
ncbi:STAS domain-containing protein [Sphingomonas lutea]|uniref:STAS domain-containing protein n=1 Tax=Sphingomonas lutea TaxID=1045317 RepID=A0A7G9SJ70_9SPHN|nr:STAS domain-containing protein [Sphingomonas lutea]QNN67895.1 STAS domain-containing protein [Sphingomonas lutea]